MKHTQGEWKVKHSESKPAFNVIGTSLGGKYKIARCPYTILTNGEPADKEEAEANAKLIAAAPELLEALTSIYTVFRNAGLEAGGHYKDYLLKAKAAIQKATE